MNADLEVPDKENGDDIDKGMTGSVTELSMNDKMHKPMLPPIDHSSVHSTRNNTTAHEGQRTGTAVASI